MLKHPVDGQTSPDKGGANFCLEFFAADLTGTTTQTLVGFTLPANNGVELVHLELPEAFVSSDATLISTSITVGDAGSATRLLSATELNAAGTEIFLKGGTLTTLPYVPTADTSVNVYLTVTSGKNLATHTAGKCRLFFRLTNPFTNVAQLAPFDITTVAAQ